MIDPSVLTLRRAAAACASRTRTARQVDGLEPARVRIEPLRCVSIDISTETMQTTAAAATYRTRQEALRFEGQRHVSGPRPGSGSTGWPGAIRPPGPDRDRTVPQLTATGGRAGSHLKNAEYAPQAYVTRRAAKMVWMLFCAAGPLEGVLGREVARGGPAGHGGVAGGVGGHAVEPGVTAPGQLGDPFRLPGPVGLYEVPVEASALRLDVLDGDYGVHDSV